MCSCSHYLHLTSSWWSVFFSDGRINGSPVCLDVLPWKNKIDTDESVWSKPSSAFIVGPGGGSWSCWGIIHDLSMWDGVRSIMGRQGPITRQEMKQEFGWVYPWYRLSTVMRAKSTKNPHSLRTTVWSAQTDMNWDSAGQMDCWNHSHCKMVECSYSFELTAASINDKSLLLSRVGVACTAFFFHEKQS